MHYTGGNIIRLPSCDSFPLSVPLARDNGPLDHRPVFVTRMRMSASADARWPLGRYQRKNFVRYARHWCLKDQRVDFNLLRKR